jgi:glycerol-1-phosphate dehydrogenase [NAD(P)+]
MRNLLSELLPGNTDIKTDVVIESSVVGAAAELLSRIGFEQKHLVLVCDVNTHAAIAERLLHELAAFQPRLVVLNGKFSADEESLRRIQSHAANAYVAIGSGTINDLCKYISHQENKPYAVFPTAPSMNGYLSANASITIQGVKESRPAHLPAGVFCDLKVIAGAPVRLIRSGLGDSLCRSTAQADWLLSHLLLDTAYTPLPFNLLKPYETELFVNADKLTSGDISVVQLLLKTLLVSGLGMTLAGGSYPASQGEHLIAHTMEMKHKDTLPATFHGEQIGVTTITMAKLQEQILARKLHLLAPPRWQESLTNYFGVAQAKSIAQTTRNKYKLLERYDAIASRLAQRELYIRDVIRQIILPEVLLRKVLLKAGAPTTPAELGWDETDYATAVNHARYTRDRFTFLDLL